MPARKPPPPPEGRDIWSFFSIARQPGAQKISHVRNHATETSAASFPNLIAHSFSAARSTLSERNVFQGSVNRSIHSPPLHLPDCSVADRFSSDDENDDEGEACDTMDIEANEEDEKQVSDDGPQRKKRKRNDALSEETLQNHQSAVAAVGERTEVVRLESLER